MFKKLFSLVLLAGLVGGSAAAQAVKVGVVDFTRAINETTEGKGAQSRLDSMVAGKKAELEQMEASLKALAKEYQTKGPTLSVEARQSYEQRLYQGQMELQQSAAMNEQAMQAQYVQVMDTVFNSLKAHAEAIGKAEGFTVILESSQGGVLFAMDGIDLTDRVIARANGR
jgi:outer membrane protein